MAYSFEYDFAWADVEVVEELYNLTDPLTPAEEVTIQAGKLMTVLEMLQELDNGWVSAKDEADSNADELWEVESELSEVQQDLEYLKEQHEDLQAEYDELLERLADLED